MQKENKVKPEKGRSRLIKDRTGLKKKDILEIEKKKWSSSKTEKNRTWKTNYRHQNKEKKLQIKVNFNLIKLDYSWD